MSDRRYAPPAGPKVYLGFPTHRPRHPDNGTEACEMADGDVGLPIGDDVNPAPIEVKIIEHPGIGPRHRPEHRNVLETPARQPPDPPFRRFFVKNDEPIVRLALGKAIPAKYCFRTLRAASISCEP